MTISIISVIEFTIQVYLMGNFSEDVFERRTSTGSETFSHLTCLNATQIVSVLSLIKKIYWKFG